MAKTLSAVRRFVKALNEHNVDGLRKAMSKNHRFIGTTGTVIKGRDAALESWQGQWATVPDYRIAIRHEVSEDKTAGLFGQVIGTFGGDPDHQASEFTLSAAWRVEVKKGRITEWQIYANVDPVRAAMMAHARATTAAEEQEAEDDES